MISYKIFKRPFDFKTLTILILFFWVNSALSKEIKYVDIRSIILTSNKKVKALNFSLKSVHLKTGYLSRSFIPEVEVSAGHESFDSDPLGLQNTEFYSIGVQANIFNGMADYWEEKKRKASFKSKSLERNLLINELVFLAQKSYLKLSKIKLMIKELRKEIKKIVKVTPKVSKKVKSGVIAHSDLIAMSLFRSSYEEHLRQLEREAIQEVNNLSVLLGFREMTLNDIDESFLSQDLKSSVEKIVFSPKSGSLMAEQFIAEAKVQEYAANSILSKRLPSVDLFANYGRMPFSRREFVSGSDRMEWVAGLQVRWKLGDLLENSRQATSLKSQSDSLEHLALYKKNKTSVSMKALYDNMNFLLGSIERLSKKMSLSQNYYSQVLSEYLRGVKATSDLIAAFRQFLDLRKKRLTLVVQFHLAQAQIDRLTLK